MPTFNSEKNQMQASQPCRSGDLRQQETFFSFNMSKQPKIEFEHKTKRSNQNYFLTSGAADHIQVANGVALLLLSLPMAHQVLNRLGWLGIII